MKDFVDLTPMESVSIVGGKNSAVAGLVYRIGIIIGATVNLIKYCRNTFSGRLRLVASN